MTTHPKENKFYTIGEENLLASWDIKGKKMLQGIKIDFPARNMHISPDAKHLAIGCLNGSVLIFDPKTLALNNQFKDRDRDVSCIKFSPECDK